MVDARSARRGAARTTSGDESDKDAFGFAGDAKRFFKNIMTEEFTDTLVELSADAEVRDRAETFGVRVADAAWESSAIRAKLALAPDILLRIGAPVFATFIAREVVQGLDRPAEWAREFAQGFARRIREFKATRDAASADASAPGAPAPAPAGSREMSAAEVLANRPALLQYIERTYTVPEEAQRVIARLHRFLNFEHEADLLLTPPDGIADPAQPAPAGGAAVSPVPAAALAAALPTFIRIWPDAVERAWVLSHASRFLADDALRTFLLSAPSGDEAVPVAIAADPVWARFTVTVAGISPNEAAELIAEAAKRVTDSAQVQALIVPPPGAAVLTVDMLRTRILVLPVRTMVLTREVLVDRLESLEQVVPAPAFAPVDVPRDVFERRMTLIEDAHSDRHLSGPLKAGLERLTAIGHTFFGNSEQIGGFVDEGTNFFDELTTSFFGPQVNNQQGGGT